MSCRSCHDSYQPEIDRLRAELDETQQALTSEAGWRCKYEAAIARVRELCADAPTGRFIHLDKANEYLPAVRVADVLRALDGGAE